MLTRQSKQLSNCFIVFSAKSIFKNNLFIFQYSKIQKQLQFTQAFEKAVSQKLAKKPLNSFLRLQISAGEGCEGFTYKFKFDEKLKQNDYVYTITQEKLVQRKQKIIFATNGEQMKLLKGATIDYAEQMMREIFYVKENPNAQISCSCKTSFSPKEYIL